jgi:hypothetical protein
MAGRQVGQDLVVDTSAAAAQRGDGQRLGQDVGTSGIGTLNDGVDTAQMLTRPLPYLALTFGIGLLGLLFETPLALPFPHCVLVVIGQRPIRYE